MAANAITKGNKPREERRSSRTLFLRKRTRMSVSVRNEQDLEQAMLQERKSYLYACRSRILRSMLLVADHCNMDASSLNLA